ncbi:hypothetical protein [Heyndrickxia acidicola]|uniref:Uncharacterized protein n=1 Tax=Heyndrickxia acidicola TaxID=209389 RepID=A0ABU6MSC8_9BACI|nr:hypothetical protein [Heyndrickxia acidicola]MED1206102.1 hypothetical protein [Heyndrickxia acidicola]
MSQEAVHHKLYNGEHIIHTEVDDDNSYSKKEYFLTSKGRVIEYNGGYYSPENRIKVYDQKLDVTSYFDRLTLKPNNNASEFKFFLSLDIQSFKDILKKIPFSCLVFDMNTDFFKRHEVDSDYIPINLSYDLSNLGFKQSESNFLEWFGKKIKVSPDIIPFYRIKKVEQIDSYTLNLHGFFFLNEQPYHKIEIIHWDERNVHDLKNSIESHKSIFNLVSDEVDLYTCKVNGLLGGQKIKSNSMIMAVAKMDVKHDWNISSRKGLLSFIDEETQSLVQTIDLANCEFYIEEQENRILILTDTSSFYVELPETIISDLNQGPKEISQNKWWFQCAEQSGLMEGRHFSTNLVSLAFEPSSITLIYDFYTRDICKIELDNHATLIDNKSVFIVSSKDNSITVIQFLEPNLFEALPINAQDLQIFNVGITPNKLPFLIKQTEEQIELAQSNNDVLLRIPNTNVEQILVVEQPVDGSELLLIEIREISGVNHQLYLEEESVKRLIKNTYQYVKMPTLSSVSNEDIFFSWSRSINELILYNMFQEILTLHSLVKEIQEKNINSMEKQVKLANGLFHSIKLIKRNLDRIATQLPLAIDNMERTYFTQEQLPYGAPFHSLQMGLIMVANHMKGYIMEIENQLAPIHFAILPRVDPEELLKKNKQRNKKSIGASIGLGLLSLLTGNIMAAISIPTMMTLSTRHSNNSNKDQLNAMKENELNTLEFYTTQAVDTLEHVLTVIIPYLITETNRSIFNSLQELYQWYIPLLGTISMKNKLFNEISELYLYKQLPMNENTVKSRQELIYAIHKSHSDVVNQTLELKG